MTATAFSAASSGSSGVEGGGVDEVAEEARALDVPEEADAEAVALAARPR